ncbi:N-acetylneuraminate synthase [Pseudoalteromonas shioyasakiensis]|uniref:N-acetylneuraminate synthase n=1 Tax=Pseudoalteromonas shioyasakiensis TaxID=1190813 RepID=UPI002117F3C9|nr:N-acetylneuraminate synthase [Pseudoalteromonas shioyasakiensis]MCQ8877373.1 N-acetylneuraminate synthase [Pseudoalteromonas shioyasakiensis]
MSKKTLVIAEAGVNHNGDEQLALELVRQACQAGADIVKFQTFKAKNIVTSEAEQAIYQRSNTGVIESQLTMLRRLELSFSTHFKLIEECNKLGIEFLSTAFDSESLDFLVKDLKLTRLKIPSGELTNLPLVLKHAQSGCNLILSTGMATLGEIESALGVIAFGLMFPTVAIPKTGDFEHAYASQEGQELLRNKVTLLHCTTEYPAPLNEINLSAMTSMAKAFDLDIGYSDHSLGWVVPVAAVASGAKIIEKHFTLDKSLEGPDHKASLAPSELAEMVTFIRQTEQVMGSKIKAPTKSEIANKVAARKSLVATKDISAGTIFDYSNLEVKRPGSGMSPSFFWEVLGTKASYDYKAGQLIDE